ncbi:hypothetical protein JYU34_000955 [Plutella xylostella]|uniref:Uncharacterized protein n=1 Tax=Plutella xylostella TaxID=51655 RepID=A0ABQ7R5Q3_PLUXY|nr:hypothetical protein JYU34_000955 [Plutella xylostella]
MESPSNITLRKKARRHSETDNTKNYSSSTLDGSTNSLPNISTESCDKLEDLRHELDDIKIQLSIAHEEVKNLSLENASLKASLEEMKKKCVLYKKVTCDVTPKKTKQTSSTPKKTNGSKVSKPKNVTLMNTSYTTTATQTDTVLPNATKYQYEPITTKDGAMKPKNNAKKHNICIISSNKNNNITEIAENTFQGNYRYCHHIHTNGNIATLISSIKTTLKNYTKNDFCVIMIGEEDFKCTSNYFDVISQIRTTLQTIDFTNIVICLPTYNCSHSKNMFNWRVETFNNLLWLDVTTHKYAHILDSNLQLTYDYVTYNMKYGTVNNNGMKNIFYKLKELLNKISNLDTSYINNKIVNDDNIGHVSETKSKNNSNNFFLL